MTLTRLPGMYFTEEITTIASEIDSEEKLTFIVQTSSAITAIDNKLTYFEDFNSFETIARNKGLTKTLETIDTLMANVEQTGFYVYSVKTDTADGWKESINSSKHLKDNRRFIYFEETAASQSFSLANKVSALTTACHTCYDFGAFRTVYIIPYKTITDAVSGAENATPEETVITTFTSLLSGDGDGRCVMLLPDAYSQMMATIINAGYDTEPGYPEISGSVGSLTYNFTYEQMLTLMNLGVIFPRQEKVEGVYTYRINLGVTTSFKSSKADGLLMDRLIADELLHTIDENGSGAVKDKEDSANIAFVQATVDNVINKFVADGNVTSSGTSLQVTEAGNMKYNITGKITTVKSLAVIEVSATLY